jgi:hypothetical protein
VDTLAKLLRVGDVNDYAKVMPQIEKIHDLARRYPHLHVQGLAHCKKAQTTDVFDSLLGSTALRGEPDTTIALYKEHGQPVIETETRIGRNIPATILRASVVESAGAHVVSGFELDTPFADWQKSQADEASTKRRATHEERIIAYLQGRWDMSAPYADVLAAVEGRKSIKIEAIERLNASGVLSVTGKKQSPADPLVLHLNESGLVMHDFQSRFGGDNDEN